MSKHTFGYLGSEREGRERVVIDKARGHSEREQNESRKIAHREKEQNEGEKGTARDKKK